MIAPAATWQLDRLSTSAREAAETAARDAGLSLSAWLTRLIDETCDSEGVAAPQEAANTSEFTPAPDAPPPAAPDAPHAATDRAAAEPQPGTLIESEPRAPAMPIIEPVLELKIGAAPQPATGAASLLSMRPVRSNALPPMPSGGATMLRVAAIAPANLGSRRGEAIPEALLADIAKRGVRQPITVRRAPREGEHYEIICGHRRWRAAQRIGLAQIPALIVAQEDAAALLASLAENLQSGTLSVMDEAHAYLRLLTQYALDAATVTAATGRERGHIAQAMRLLGLPPSVRDLIGSGMLPPEHAYLLLEAAQPQQLAEAIIAENLTIEAARQRLGSASGTRP